MQEKGYQGNLMWEEGTGLHRVSEFVKLQEPVEHLDIQAWDDPEPGHLACLRMAACSNLKNVISLDASRLGMDDADVISLIKSPFFNVKWLCLAGNSRVGEKAVRAICECISSGCFDLDWLDLRGTDYEATPYLDGGEWGWDGEDLWRIPKITRDLIKSYGVQRWMTLGHPIEEENNVYISGRAPSRYGITRC